MSQPAIHARTRARDLKDCLQNSQFKAEEISEIADSESASSVSFHSFVKKDS